VGKTGVLEHKSGNISETRKVEAKLPWRPLEGLKELFRPVPSPTPYSLLFPKIGGSQPPPKAPIAIISEQGKAIRLQIWPVHSQDPSEQKPMKNLVERQRGRIQGLPILKVSLIISGTNGQSCELQILYAHS